MKSKTGMGNILLAAGALFLAAALLLGMALERLPGAHGFALLRLTPSTAQAMSAVRWVSNTA